MGTFLPLHLPVNAAPIPRSLVLDPPLTDAELEQFCHLNDAARIERTKEELIRMNPPAGMFTSDENAELLAQLRGWWKTHRRGRVWDSNAGFYLPDGSIHSPVAAYLLPETLARTASDKPSHTHHRARTSLKRCRRLPRGLRFTPAKSQKPLVPAACSA